MKEIFNEYGGIIVTVVAIVLFIAVIRLVIGNDTSSIVYEAFMNIFKQLFNNTGLSNIAG